MSTPTRSSPMTPPTTPPTIAPRLLFFVDPAPALAPAGAAPPVDEDVGAELVEDESVDVNGVDDGDMNVTSVEVGGALVDDGRTDAVVSGKSVTQHGYESAVFAGKT